MMEVEVSDQAAQNRLVANDLHVDSRIRSGRYGIDQVGQVREAARRLQLAPTQRLVTQGDVIDTTRRSVRPSMARKNSPVSLPIEHGVVHQLRRARCGVLIEGHRSQNCLLASGPRVRSNQRTAQRSRSVDDTDVIPGRFFNSGF